MKQTNKIIIGLTGGIATGKSAVANIWRDLGADVICADEISREISSPGGSAYMPLQKAFAGAFVQGVLCRRTLRELVFINKEKLDILNAVMHPLIKEESVHRMGQSAKRIVVLEAPLLFEAGFDNMVEKTVCTVCSRASQIARLCARDRCTQEQAAQIIFSQMDTVQKAALCDIVLDTDVSVKQLKIKATEIFQKF